MEVSREEVERVAKLAALRLSDDEAERLRRDLEGILDHMEALAELEGEEARGDASGGASPGAPGGASGGDLLRDEGEIESDRLHRSPAALAPDWGDGFFLVPRLRSLDPADRGAEGGAGERPREAPRPEEGAGSEAGTEGDGEDPS